MGVRSWGDDMVFLEMLLRRSGGDTRSRYVGLTAQRKGWPVSQEQAAQVEEKSNAALVHAHQKREKSKLVQGSKGKDSGTRRGGAERE